LALFFLRKSKNFLPTKALKSLYYYLFHSVLIYGIQIWSSASPSNFACLKLEQKAAVRIVLGANYNDHTEPIFKHLNILPLDALCKFFDLQFMQHFIQDFLPDSFNNMWFLMPIVEMQSSILLSETTTLLMSHLPEHL
jgi:hypothetical protein